MPCAALTACHCYPLHAATQDMRSALCRLQTVPACIFRECAALSTLHLQNNPITADALRELDGFGAYNARRLAKSNKQVRVLAS